MISCLNWIHEPRAEVILFYFTKEYRATFKGVGI